MTLCQIFGSVGATINQELPSPPIPVDQLSTYQILPEVSRSGNKREEKQQIWTIFYGLIDQAQPVTSTETSGSEQLGTIVVRDHRLGGEREGKVE